MGNPIQFYHQNRSYGFFSNFAPYPISIKGKNWPTTEHYFQAQKFAGTPHEEAIRQAKTPGDAAQMGRDRQRPLRPDWEQIKDGIMGEALYAKFTQHPDLQQHLLDTGTAQIVEHTRNDFYWGDGGDGSGQNKLGQLLMAVRDQIRAEIGAGVRSVDEV